MPGLFLIAHEPLASALKCAAQHCFPEAVASLQSLDVSGPMDVFAEANRFLAPEDHYRLDVIGLEHTYGCGVAIDAPDAGDVAHALEQVLARLPPARKPLRPRRPPSIPTPTGNPMRGISMAMARRACCGGIPVRARITST